MNDSTTFILKIFCNLWNTPPIKEGISGSSNDTALSVYYHDFIAQLDIQICLDEKKDEKRKKKINVYYLDFIAQLDIQICLDAKKDENRKKENYGYRHERVPFNAPYVLCSSRFTTRWNQNLNNHVPFFSFTFRESKWCN